MELVGPDQRQMTDEQQQVAEGRPVAAFCNPLQKGTSMFAKMTTSNTGGDFAKATPGMVSAVCVRLIDMGTQDGGQWGPKRKLMLAFEIDEARDDGKRFVVSASFNLSLHAKAALRQNIESWRGKAYGDGEPVDLTKLLGKPAMLNLVESEDGQYINIKSISPLAKGMTALEPEGDVFIFDFDAPDWDRFEGFGARLKERMLATPEYAKATGKAPAPQPNPTVAVGEITEPAAATADFDDDIPF
jgi:hypothetical protein